MTQSCSGLVLQDFGVAFGDRIVLNAVNLKVDGPGMHVIMGPVGTGKSTLLRTISGINQAVPTCRTWGQATYMGSPLSEGYGPALVAQNARILMSSILENIISELPKRGRLTMMAKREVAKQLLEEAGLAHLIDCMDRPAVELPLAVQRHLAIARTVASEPQLLCVDEPTAGLESQDGQPIIDFLKVQGNKRGVLVVSHNQQEALKLDGHVALLAGGTVQAYERAKVFFTTPPSSVVREFVRTGSCCLPSPNAKPEEIDESMLAYLPVVPEVAKHYVRESLGPRGFLWLKKGFLAGTPRPGIVQDIDYDLECLKRVGITILVSLTTKPVEPGLLEKYGIKGLWLPIKDMHPPDLEEAEQMCRQVASLMAEGSVVAYHCRAGLGRTGTMLASHLIMEGQTALNALESVRMIEPQWVQSEEQVRFLERFSNFVSGRQKKSGQTASILAI